MDIVAALSAQLRLEEYAAASLAGGLLLLVEDLVMDRVGYGPAGRMRQAVPELREWQSAAPTLAPGMFNLANLPAPQGGGDEGAFVDVLSRHEVDTGAAPGAAALVFQFLSTRLDEELLATVTGAVPILTRKP